MMIRMIRISKEWSENVQFSYSSKQNWGIVGQRKQIHNLKTYPENKATSLLAVP